MLRFMLDTNICIYTIKNRPDGVRAAFYAHEGQLCISAVTHMELVFGAERSATPAANLQVLEGFFARLEVLPFDIPASAQVAQIRADLAAKGTPIGPYDTMIAGHARSLGLVLVTNNVREFERVEGLRVVNWVERDN